jgi:hypothetical protein
LVSDFLRRIDRLSPPRTGISKSSMCAPGIVVSGTGGHVGSRILTLPWLESRAAQCKQPTSLYMGRLHRRTGARSVRQLAKEIQEM